MARTAAREGAGLQDALDAELWASGLVGAWNIGRTPWLDLDELLGRPMVVELERIGSGGALAALRALAAVAPAVIARDSGASARRLAEHRVLEPAWRDQLGSDRAVAARAIRDATFDDTSTVLVEFLRPTGERYTLGVQIDHNLGGIARDAFVTGTLAELVHDLRPADVSVAAAGVRLRDALAATDRAVDVPPSVELSSLRAFVDSRVSRLPVETVVRKPREMGDAEREALLHEFLSAAEGAPFERSPRAHDIVRLAIDFAADYVDGRPLRWSPGVVDRFMSDWLPHRTASDPELADRVGEVLPSWVRYAGRRWGAPSDAVEEAALAVVHLQEGLRAAADDPPRQLGRAGAKALAGIGSTPWP